jgi:hypothetical protein
VSLFVLPAVYSLMATRTRHPLIPIPDFALPPIDAGRHAAD